MQLQMTPTHSNPTNKKQENSESAFHAENVDFLSNSEFRGF